MQGMLLIAIVATTVMQAIGDSIARGLGMLGALAIIRFRTTLRNPRNITFVFASLAAGIACGVYGFVIALIGTAGFCTSAFLLKFSYFGRKKDLTGNLRIDVTYNKEVQDSIEKILKQFCTGFELVEINSRNLKPRKPNTKEDTKNEEAVIEKSNSEETNEIVKKPKIPKQTLIYKVIMKQLSDSVSITSSLYDINYVNNVKLRFRKEQDEI